MGSVLRDTGASGTGGRPEACHAGSDTSVFFKTLERFTVHRKLRQEDDHFQASLNYQSNTKKKGINAGQTGKVWRWGGREGALPVSTVAFRSCPKGPGGPGRPVFTLPFHRS